MTPAEWIAFGTLFSALVGALGKLIYDRKSSDRDDTTAVVDAASTIVKTTVESLLEPMRLELARVREESSALRLETAALRKESGALRREVRALRKVLDEHGIPAPVGPFDADD